MKKLYWVIGLCLCVIMLGLASGCGGSGTTTSANPTDTTSPTQTTTPGGEGGSIADILGKGSNIASIKYDMVMNVMGQTITANVWQKGKKIREEMTLQGMTTIIIMDMDAGFMYTYMPSTNTAMKMTLDASQIPQGSPESNNEILQYNPTIVGTESIDGKSCTIITWEVPGQGAMKMWVWTEQGFPLKMEVTASGVTSTIEFNNFDLSDIPDSQFELPADVQIITQ